MRGMARALEAERRRDRSKDYRLLSEKQNLEVKLGVTLKERKEEREDGFCHSQQCCPW
jgi:hypothetical protein